MTVSPFLRCVNRGLGDPDVGEMGRQKAYRRRGKEGGARGVDGMQIHLERSRRCD